MSDSEISSSRPAARFLPALLGALIGSLLTLIVLAGLAITQRPRLSSWLFGEDLPVLQARIAAIETHQADLQTRLDQPQQGVLLPDDLTQHLAKIDSDLEQLRRSIPPEGLLLRLNERTEAAERSIREVTASFASSQSLLLIVGQLRAAVDRGDSYDLELAALRRQLSAEDAAMIAPLAKDAAHGILRHDQLRQSWPAVTARLLDQENAAVGPGVWPVIWRHLQKLVAIRRMDGKGNDAEAVLARAEAALAKDDWDQMVAELQALPGPFAATAAPWLDQADARVAADHALSKVTAWAALRISSR